MYTQHYSRHIECDFCGQMTRGRVWEDDPTKVKCGACNGVLFEKGTNDEKSTNNSWAARNRQDNNSAKNSRRRTSSWDPS